MYKSESYMQRERRLQKEAQHKHRDFMAGLALVLILLVAVVA